MIGTPQNSSNSDSYILRPRNGVFTVYNSSKQHDDVSHVSGIFDGIDIMHDPGNNKPGSMPIEPYDALRVFIRDTTDGGDERYIVRAKMSLSFTKSLLEQLQHMEKGDQISISVKNGDKKPTVTLVSVKKMVDGEGWKYTPTKIEEAKDYTEFAKSLSSFRQ